MRWDAYFRSGFHPDGTCFGSRKEQERKTCQKMHIGRLELVMKRKKCVEEWLKEQGHWSLEQLYRQGNENTEFIAME